MDASGSLAANVSAINSGCPIEAHHATAFRDSTPMSVESALATPTSGELARAPPMGAESAGAGQAMAGSPRSNPALRPLSTAPSLAPRGLKRPAEAAQALQAQSKVPLLAKAAPAQAAPGAPLPQAKASSFAQGMLKRPAQTAPQRRVLAPKKAGAPAASAGAAAAVPAGAGLDVELFEAVAALRGSRSAQPG
ncbi:unnamed protein product, partial [Prorocentrum cordatum]